MFEARQGHQNGTFQEQLYRQNNFEENRPNETGVGRNRRMNNNHVFEPEPTRIGIG